MNQQVSGERAGVWFQLVESKRMFALAFQQFLSEEGDRVGLLKQALYTGGVERATALSVIPHLPLAERMQLFPDLVFFASSAHGSIQAFRDIILALPHDWLLAHIEREAEPLLREGTYDEYRRFLELYHQLDRDLTLKLARRATAQADEDIQEAGADFLDKLGVK